MSLDQKFKEFVLSIPSIEDIDSLPKSDIDHNKKKADYLGMGRKIIFEQKSITKDQADKIQSIVEQYSHLDEYPVFYGKRDLDLALENLPGNEKIKSEILSKITKLIESYLRQADKQIASTKQQLGLNESSGALLILNERVKVLSPEIISYTIQKRLREETMGDLRFRNIDHVIYISETHHINGATVSLIIEGKSAKRFGNNVNEYFDYLLHSWGAFKGGGTKKGINTEEFFNSIEEKQEPIPKKVTRSQARVLWYRSNRYMKDWNNEQVASTAAKLIDSMAPYFIKNGPQVPPGVVAEMAMEFGDFIEEANIRGLDIREFGKYHKRGKFTYQAPHGSHCRFFGHTIYYAICISLRYIIANYTTNRAPHRRVLYLDRLTIVTTWVTLTHDKKFPT